MSAAVEPAAAVPSPDDLRRLHARLSATLGETDAAGFCARYAAELVNVLGVAGTAVWTVDADRRPHPAAAANVDAQALRSYERLAREVAEDGRGTLVPTDRERNPTGHAVMLYPARLGTATVGVIGVLVPTDAPRGFAAPLGRMLVPLCDFVAEAVRRHPPACAGGSNVQEPSASAGGSLTDFALRIHASLDLLTTAERIANEARRLLDCDRVAVGVYRRRQATALAFSGQDRFDPRSNLVRRWEALAAIVAAAGEPLDVPRDGDQPPQVEAVLQPYLDEAHARRLIVVPLAVGKGDVVGVLTAEQIAPARDGGDAALGHVSSLAPHAATALANAARYDALPLRFLSVVPGALRAVTAARNLPKTAVVSGLLATMLAVLTLLPWDFTVEAPGTLQPVVRRDVFATVDGTVERIFVQSGDRVAAGDPLVALRSHELDFAEADLVKRINETEQELLNAERLYNQGRTLTPDEQARLPAQIALLEQRRESLRREAALLAEKRGRLRITSPLDGQVATWNVVELLDQRPVRQGQVLLNLVAPDGDWEVEVRLPEDRLGSVVEAQRDDKAALDVTFATATEPGRAYRGTIASVGPAAEPYGDEGNVVRVRTAIDKRQLAELHPGADVRVRIHCGSRSLGYVMFHDVWNFVQSRILFRL